MKQAKRSTLGVTILRWIAFLPVAALSATIAWNVVRIGNNITGWKFEIQPDGPMIMLFASAAQGAAFVFFGTLTAPTRKNTITYILTGMMLISAGGLLFLGFPTFGLRAIIMAAGLGVSSCVVAYSLITKTPLED